MNDYKNFTEQLNEGAFQTDITRKLEMVQDNLEDAMREVEDKALSYSKLKKINTMLSKVIKLASNY